MDTLGGAAAVYLFLLVLLRIAGRRTLAEFTPFDFILLLIIGEATQQALLGDDSSLTNSFLVVGTLVGIDVLLGQVKGRWKSLAKLIDGVPTVLVENGRPLPERMKRARVDLDDVMHFARQSQGIERIDEIKYAILEISGGITVIPQKKE
jgi:uncharacterized membrane protein YcaP (DUF421 family)